MQEKRREIGIDLMGDAPWGNHQTALVGQNGKWELIENSQHKGARERIEGGVGFLATIIDSLTDPFYIIDTSDYTVKLANSAANLGKLTRTSTCFALIHGRKTPCNSEHTCPLEQVKRTKKPVVVQHIHYDKEGNRKDLEIHAYPIFGSDGNVGQIIEYCLDSTEEKQIAQALRYSQEKLNNILRFSPDAIAISDLKGTLIKYNQAALDMHGFSAKEEVIEKSVFEFVAQEDRQRALEDMEKTLQKGPSLNNEYTLLTKDGSKFKVELSVNVIRDDYGKPVSFVAITKDISERNRERKAEERIEQYTNKLEKRNEQLRKETRKTKEAEKKTRQYDKELRMVNLRLKAETEKVKEASRLKSQFLANMSHEIRSPLTVIDGAVHLLQEKSLSPEARDLLALMRDSDEQLLEIINAILDLARIETGQAKVVKKEFLLKETVKNIISGFEFEARKKGLEIEMIYPRNLPSMISTDEGKLTEIFSNLISNAMKFTEKGRIEIRLDKENNSSVRFSVEDTGIGIPQKELLLIFSKFYQMNGTTRREHGSVGLGLTIVKKLVDLLGGKIQVKSKPGKGSLFCFSLPCVSSKERVVPDSNGNGTPPQTEERLKKGVNILIAEDDSSTYDIIRRFLQGCTISRAVDGEDVLKKIKRKSYDMVLMDIRMPKMDGLEATRRIREKDSDLPIIAVTARSFKTDEDECLAAGCNGYIAKPIAPQELIAEINKYAVKRLSRRQNSPPK